jgi:hypothetical protein
VPVDKIVFKECFKTIPGRAPTRSPAWFNMTMAAASSSSASVWRSLTKGRASSSDCPHPVVFRMLFDLGQLQNLHHRRHVHSEPAAKAAFTTRKDALSGFFS